jgi:hypothetical protein
MSEHYIKFTCIDCNDEVHRFGEVVPGEQPERCFVCLWISNSPLLTIAEKERLQQWGRENVK